MDDPDMSGLLKAVTDRQLAVTALQEKYATSEGKTTEQLVLDMGELLTSERLIFDAITTLFMKLSPVETSEDVALV